MIQHDIRYIALLRKTSRFIELSQPMLYSYNLGSYCIHSLNILFQLMQFSWSHYDNVKAL